MYWSRFHLRIVGLYITGINESNWFSRLTVTVSTGYSTGPMTLPEYLKSLPPEQKEAFAARLRALKPSPSRKNPLGKPLSVPLHYLYLLEHEIRRPAPANCWMYVEASNGLVTLAELRPELCGKQTTSESAA